METMTILSIMLLSAAAGAVVVWFILHRTGSGENEREKFQTFAADLFESKLKSVVDVASGSFKEREERVDKIFKEIRTELQKHREYVETVEKDRIKTHAELKEGLSTSFDLMDKLRTTTERLRNVLSSSQTRGKFGQKIAEDILKAGNLIEGVHYHKEKSQETVSTRPDFIFLLPEDYKLNMDVKFPLANYARMIKVDGWADDSNEESKRYKKAFEKDVKEKIKEISGRQYINPTEGTLDFALMFIPNEGIASFINEEFPELFNFAMEKRIHLTSPYNLISVVSMIQRAYQNFYQKENIRDTLILFSEFSNRYQLFKKRFKSIGINLIKAQQDYNDVSDKSFRLIDSTMNKIEKSQTEKSLITDKTEKLQILDQPNEDK